MFDAAPTPAALMQNPAFAAALRACGQNPLTLPSSGLTLLHRHICGLPVAMLPRAHPPPTLRDDLHHLGLHRIPLILSPPTADAPPRALKLRAPQPVAVIDLTAPTHKRRAALHPKWRNQLRRAEAAKLRLTNAPLPPDPHHPLLMAEAAQARARGYANWPAALTAAFARAAPDQTHLFTAWQGRKPVAHMLFLRHGRGASYHIGHISNAGKSTCAHNLLLWQAADWLADQGVTQLDLGPLHPRSPGLTRFKQRAGAQVQMTGGTWLRWTPLARYPLVDRAHPC